MCFHELVLEVTTGKQWKWAGVGGEDWRFLKPSLWMAAVGEEASEFHYGHQWIREKILMTKRIVILPGTQILTLAN